MRTMTITMCQAPGRRDHPATRPGHGLAGKAVKAATPGARPGGTRGRQQHSAEHAYRIR
jgi:hypothetical protein